jgi:hypothetical protein
MSTSAINNRLVTLYCAAYSSKQEIKILTRNKNIIILSIHFTIILLRITALIFQPVSLHNEEKFASSVFLLRKTATVRLLCSELSSGLYCRVKCLSTDNAVADDGGSTHLWNGGRQSFYTAVQPRRQLWTSYSPPWELEISHSTTILYAELPTPLSIIL